MTGLKNHRDIARLFAHLANCDPQKDMIFAEAGGRSIAYGRVFWRDEITIKRNREWDAVMVAFAPGARRERIPVIPDGHFVLTTPRGTGTLFPGGGPFDRDDYAQVAKQDLGI
jgi:hypothetical protein